MSSGKMVLLEQSFDSVGKEGHRVLIFADGSNVGHFR